MLPRFPRASSFEDLYANVQVSRSIRSNSLDLIVCHGGNSDNLVSIPAMTGTVAVNFCVYINGL